MGARRRNRDTAQWQAGYDYHRDFIDTMALSEGGEYDRGFTAGYDDGHKAGYKLGVLQGLKIAPAQNPVVLTRIDAASLAETRDPYAPQSHQPGGVRYDNVVSMRTVKPGDPGTIAYNTDHHFTD